MSYALAMNMVLEPPLHAFRGPGVRDEVASGPLTPHVDSILGEDALHCSICWGLECDVPGLRTSSEEKRLGLNGISSPQLSISLHFN